LVETETEGGEGKKKLLARGEAVEDAAATRSITALSWVSSNSNTNSNNNSSGVKKENEELYGIIAAYSDGTVTSHRYHNNLWSEHVIVGNDPYNPLSSSTASSTANSSTTSTTTTTNTNNRIYIHNYQESLNQSKLHESISGISCIQLDYNTWLIVTTSCVGIYLHISYVTNDDESTTSGKGGGIDMVYTHEINGNGFASVELLSSTLPSTSTSTSGSNEKICYLFAGSASPKNNKIYVYTIPYCTTSTTSGASEGSSKEGTSSVKKEAWVNLPSLEISEPICHGNLLGHQDWITCFSWLSDFNSGDDTNNSEVGEVGKRNNSLLASSGHDAKIRLWKFSTYTSSSTSKDGDNVSMLENKEEDEMAVVSDSDDDEANIDDLEEEEGEARLVITHSSSGTGASSSTTTAAVSLEALLLGHEEAVTSLTWRPNQGNKKEKPCLLSSSMDRTILLWMEEKDEEEEGGGGGGVWVPISRVGSAGGILGGSIGASLMGFVDATFSPDATRIVGHGYGGSIHFWTQVLPEKKTAVNAIEAEKIEEVETEEKIDNETLEEEEDNPPQAFEWAPPSGEATTDTPPEVEDEEDEEDVLATARWVADPCITGHFRSVEDMAWEPNGEYLLTTSSDQTTRLWTEVPVASDDNQCRWVEVGRPQVHGYDMTSIVCIGGEDDSGMGDGEPCHRFVSGADEKVLRVFDAPSSALRVLQSIKQARGCNTSNEEGSEGENQSSSWRVERAFMPSLGLTNKATADPEDQEVSKFGPVDDNDDDVAKPLDSAATKSITLQYPNVERDLAVTTLWPESRKLFGHESELVCLASYRAPSGMSSLVASSCKARNDVESAAIRLWDAKKGKCVGILKGGHRSTVSTMSFSQDGKYLASSGKDRRICIWKRVGDMNNQDDGPLYELSAAADSAHKRIVWSVHFCPKRPNILASGSRDGFVKIWRVIEGDDGSLEMMEMELCRFEPLSKAGSKNPVTAVAFADDIIEGTTDYGILSIGTESGRIEVWAVPISSSEESIAAASTLLYVLPPNESHFDTVKKVAWRPSTNSTKEDEEDMLNLTLASCGQDNGVRIFKLAIRRRNESPPDDDAVEVIKEAAANVNAVESGPKKKLICLVSNGCHDRIQSANQSKALDWFTARKVPHTVVDGMDPEQREMRNKLFGISGIRGNYPQFFFELEDGTQNFFGNFQKIEELNETNDIPKELLEQHPEIETWDKVFRDCS